MRKFFKHFGFLIVLLLVLSSCGFFLLATNPGLHFSINIATKMIGGKFMAKRLAGTLLSPISMEQISFVNNGTMVTADNLSCSWQIGKLLFGSRAITVSAANVQIKIAPSGKKNSHGSFKKITQYIVPTLFKLKDVQISGLAWHYGTTHSLQIPLIFWQLSQDTNNNLTIKTQITAKDAEINIYGSLGDNWDIQWRTHVSRFKSFIPDIDGVITAQGKIYGKRTKPIFTLDLKIPTFQSYDLSFKELQGEVLLDLSSTKNSKFGFDLAKFKLSQLHLKQIKFNGTIDHTNFWQRGFLINSILSLNKLDPINLELRLPKLTGLNRIFAEQDLDGKIDFTTKNLSVLTDIFSDLRDLSGSFTATGKIFGTVQNPQISGTAKLNSPGFRIPKLNIAPKNLAINIAKISDKISYEGEVASGSGHLQLTGEANFAGRKIVTKNVISGDKFLLSNNKEYRLLVDPQVVLQSTDDALELTGKIIIPEAVVKPNDLDNLYSLPPEIVYVQKNKEKKSSELNLKSHLHLELGSAVYLEIMGLKGKIKGEVDLVDEPQKVTVATGNLHIKDGRYYIYGQNLKITKGELYFLGGAITNPKVNIEAIRELNFSATPTFKNPNTELTVGLRMSGMLDDPKISLFSIPDGLSNPDILSYLIIGQPSSQASGSTGQLLWQAASALNIGGSSDLGNFLNKLRDKLGLGEFGFSEEAMPEEHHEPTLEKNTLREKNKPRGRVATTTVFVLGKFLTPKLYVSYSSGLLDKLNIVRVKYFLGKRWSVQTERSGMGNSAVDIVYTVEK